MTATDAAMAQKPFAISLPHFLGLGCLCSQQPILTMLFKRFPSFYWSHFLNECRETWK